MTPRTPIPARRAFKKTIAAIVLAPIVIPLGICMLAAYVIVGFCKVISWGIEQWV